MSALKEKYRKEVAPQLMELRGYQNVMQVPRLEKVSINIGLGEANQDAKALESAEKDLTTIAGKPPGCSPRIH